MSDLHVPEVADEALSAVLREVILLPSSGARTGVQRAERATLIITFKVPVGNRAYQSPDREQRDYGVPPVLPLSDQPLSSVMPSTQFTFPAIY